MTEQTANRRAEDKNMQVLATKIEHLDDAWRFDPCALRSVVKHGGKNGD